jgi:hypothetical protein
MGNSGSTAVKATTAVFDFNLRADRPNTASLPPADGSAAATADLASLIKPPIGKHFSVEFTREELLSFFEKLDKVQQQIDALSS